MVATETRNLTRNSNQMHKSGNALNGFFMIPELEIECTEFPSVKPSNRPAVSKSYEVSGKAISESYFETSYEEDDIEFINDYAQSHKNGIILVMTDEMSEYEINYFTTHMRNKIKYIIYYSGDASQFRINPSKGLTFIRTFSLKAAINEAYRNSRNGQAIILPKIDPSFDLCEYIEQLN
jgi:hypothetical protein